ncbi:MAG: WecB/TagA/CpsF family glycosyltransferase [Candidatus Moranbacteria bacterium]|nr:WecB/TagA/CpsF family glycosyltransferase [Candidatus Moranbacteria bacterium]
MDILGVKIDNLSRQEILDKISVFLQEGGFHQIATVNPEFILQAQQDGEFKDILSRCDLNVADGVGIWFAFLRFGKYLKNRMAGTDLMEEILKIADTGKYRVFLAGYGGALSSWQEARDAILKKYPDVEISGATMDGKRPIECPTGQPIGNYEVVFCNFGAPDQEKFLHSLKTLENSKIRLAMGVGGSFDFLTGRIKRAPECIRMAGLEWLWRFLQEPGYRAKRIFKALVVFPVRVVLDK